MEIKDNINNKCSDNVYANPFSNESSLNRNDKNNNVKNENNNKYKKDAFIKMGIDDNKNNSDKNNYYYLGNNNNDIKSKSDNSLIKIKKKDANEMMNNNEIKKYSNKITNNIYINSKINNNINNNESISNKNNSLGRMNSTGVSLSFNISDDTSYKKESIGMNDEKKLENNIHKRVSTFNGGNDNNKFGLPYDYGHTNYN
jgi:hypothetical protein